MTTEIKDVARVLYTYGEMFHGGRAEEITAEWVDHDFDADEVDQWCAIGMWDASTAAAFRNADASPREVKRAADEMARKHAEYPGNDPIYAMCNSDMDILGFIETITA